ncbi:helix-turn-helix transcriptional regulator [Clostridium perfringens]|nr:helix-turn-helix transcriptional regulator [Clostridium perfringens]MDM0986649.1 helix-turn-helix transcriptional regulator [Clostridium perfringens]
MKYDKELIGKRIKEIRTNRFGLYKTSEEKKHKKYSYCKTQESLADKLNIERRTVGSWERCETIPSLENLINLCEILDCNIEYFLGADELPYINSVSKISYFTGINPEIISLAMENSDYLDCLNFFMLPGNCTELYHAVTLSAWKKFWINESLDKIKNPLLEIINKAFDKFYLSTPTQNINPDTFKKYLCEYLPEDKLIFTDTGDDKSYIYIKDCFSLLQYKDFKSKCNKENQYNFFIDYICSLSFNSLQNGIYLELHKKKVADKFICILNNYLNDL